MGEVERVTTRLIEDLTIDGDLAGTCGSGVDWEEEERKGGEVCMEGDAGGDTDYMILQI